MKDMRQTFLFVAPAVLAALPAHADEGGLPQFDVTFFPGQIIWLALSFGFLYLMMALIALPRVATTKSNRKSTIAAEIEAARSASETAKATVASVEKSLNDARATAQASVNEMVVKVTEDAHNRQVTQEKELLRKLRSAEESIAVTREAALKSVSSTSKELTESIVEKILGRRAA